MSAVSSGAQSRRYRATVRRERWSRAFRICEYGPASMRSMPGTGRGHVGSLRTDFGRASP